MLGAPSVRRPWLTRRDAGDAMQGMVGAHSARPAAAGRMIVRSKRRRPPPCPIRSQGAAPTRCRESRPRRRVDSIRCNLGPALSKSEDHVKSRAPAFLLNRTHARECSGEGLPGAGRDQGRYVTNPGNLFACFNDKHRSAGRRWARALRVDKLNGQVCLFRLNRVLASRPFLAIP